MLASTLALSCRGADTKHGEPRASAIETPTMPAANSANSANAATAVAGAANAAGDEGAPSEGPALPPPRAPLALAAVKQCTPWPNPVPTEVGSLYDVVYTSPHGQPQHLDLAWPKAPGAHPMVVMIHGGAWVGGDREYHRNDILRLAGAGYVAATIDYRLAKTPANAFPAALEDVRCAVRWLRREAGRFSGNPDRIAAFGDSSGGHLAALLAVAPEIPGDGTCPIVDEPADVQAAVLDYAPLDLRAFRTYPESIQQATWAFLGARPALDPPLVALASPITHLDANDPPMLVLHATPDPVVPVQQSREFARALQVAGVPSLFLELPDLPHGFLVLGSGEILRTPTCTTMAFLDATLKR